MRILFAKLLVVVTGLLIVLLAILFAAIRNSSVDSAPRPAEAMSRGRAVYVEQRCPLCHSLEGEGGTRSSLDGVGGRLTEQEIRLWIVAPQEMRPTVAKRGYRLSEEDLDALVTYLIGK